MDKTKRTCSLGCSEIEDKVHIFFYCKGWNAERYQMAGIQLAEQWRQLEDCGEWMGRLLNPSLASKLEWRRWISLIHGRLSKRTRRDI